MIFNYKTWCVYIYIYLHTYIYGAVNTDTHGWGRATETLALGCPGTTTRFRDLSDTENIHNASIYVSRTGCVINANVRAVASALRAIIALFSLRERAETSPKVRASSRKNIT